MNTTDAWALERPATPDAATPAPVAPPGAAAPAWVGLLVPAAGLLALAGITFALPQAFTAMVPAAVLAGWAGWRLGFRHGADRREPEAAPAEAHDATAAAMMQALAECSEHAVMAKALDGRYVVFNRAAQRFSGSQPQAGVGDDAKTLFGPARGARMQAMDRRIVATGLTERCLQEVDTPEGRATYHVTKGPLRDAQGQVLGVYGIAQDVTRQHAEQALLHQLLHAAELCSQRIIVTTLDAVVVYANAAALAAAGRTREQMLGSNWRHTLAEALPGEACAALWAGVQAGHSWRGQLSSTGPDGQPRVAQAVISPLSAADGQVTHVVALLQALTEQQRGVHDLVQQRQHLEALLAQCRAERVQGTQPAGATAAPPAGEPLALRALLASGCDALRPLAAAQRVQIHWHADAELPEAMPGEWQHLPEMLHALVVQAILSCAGLERQGLVRVRAELAGCAKWRLSVADNGPGMDAAAQARVLGPEAGAERPVLCATGGANPDLARVRQQVEALGGSIDVYSVREAGTVYALDLPMPAAHTPPAA